MSEDVELGCRCGEVRGRLRGVDPRKVNRVVCYCDDCQAYVHHLGRADLLDVRGGSDIVQVAPSALAFDRGAERIAGVRLSPKGMYRWYATCCKTPVGNTVTPAIPFIGIGVGALGVGDPARRDDLFGKAQLVGGKHAIGEPPEGSTRLRPTFLLRVVRLLLGWKLRGKTWPHPFFERKTRKPSRPVTMLSPEERDALRPLCGPSPSVAR